MPLILLNISLLDWDLFNSCINTSSGKSLTLFYTVLLDGGDFLVGKQKGPYKYVNKWKHLGHHFMIFNLKCLPSPKCYGSALCSTGLWANLLTVVTVKPEIWNVRMAFLWWFQCWWAARCFGWLLVLMHKDAMESGTPDMVLRSLKPCYWSLVTLLWKIIIHRCNRTT